MTFNKYKSAILLSFFCLSMFPQLVPGYMGRKNIISYQDNMSVSFNEPSYLNRTLDNDIYTKTEESLFIPVNNTHCISYERVLKRRFALGLNYALAATKTYVNLNGTYIDPANSQRTNYNFENIKTNVFAHYITGSFIFYGKKTPAPLGLYFKINMGICMIKAKLIPDEPLKTTPTSQTAPSTIYEFDASSGYFGVNRFNLGFTLGSHRIYANRWVVTRGMNLNFLTGGDDSSLYTNAYEKVRSRVNRHDVFTFYLGLGYLM